MEYPHPTSLSGALLLAHPALLDPNFVRSVVLISAHTPEDGAWGVILNRPAERTLGEFDEAFAMDPLGKIPLYLGGPVGTTQVVLAALQWSGEDGVFRLMYGIDRDRARVLMAEEEVTVRAYLGYSGWGAGQLEEELGQHSWLVHNLVADAVAAEEGGALWRRLVGSISPEMRLMAAAPDDPEAN